jgi:hypothetical protein
MLSILFGFADVFFSSSILFDHMDGLTENNGRPAIK